MKHTLFITLITSLCVSAATAADPALVQKVATGIASLPSSKVIVQQVADVAPAAGGTETVLVHGTKRYTVWTWDYKRADGTSVKWLRVYVRQNGTVGDDTLFVVGDANLTGKVADAFSAKDKSLGSIFTSFGADHTAVYSKDIVTETPAEVQAKIQSIWQQRYDSVIAALADYLEQHS